MQVTYLLVWDEERKLKIDSTVSYEPQRGDVLRIAGAKALVTHREFSVEGEVAWVIDASALDYKRVRDILKPEQETKHLTTPKALMEGRYKVQVFRVLTGEMEWSWKWRIWDSKNEVTVRVSDEVYPTEQAARAAKSQAQADLL